MKRKHYEKHIQKECPKRIIYCSECTECYLFINGHQCPEEIVSCSACKLELKRKNGMEHFARCPNRISQCLKCQTNFLYVEGHLCDEDIVSCLECGSQYKRKESILHSNRCSTIKYFPYEVHQNINRKPSVKKQDDCIIL